jgi:rare lipoprotein A
LESAELDALKSNPTVRMAPLVMSAGDEKAPAKPAAAPVKLAETETAPVVPGPTKLASAEPHYTSDVKTSLVEPKPAQPHTAAKPANTGAKSMFFVQAGAFASEERAKAMAEKLDRFGARVMQAMVDERQIFRVRIGPFLDIMQARTAIDEAKSLGYTDVQIVTQ